MSEVERSEKDVDDDATGEDASASADANDTADAGDPDAGASADADYTDASDADSSASADADADDTDASDSPADGDEQDANVTEESGAPPEEKRDSSVDAMGRDKHREVIGGQYGATLRKRLLVYGAAVGFIALIVIVSLTFVRGYDGRDMPLKDTAPWTRAGATQTAPRDADFPNNGPTNTIRADKIYHQ